MSPETIGRYSVIRELGRGAMGVVYEAGDPNLGRTVALKTVHANAIGTDAEQAGQRFKNEARAVGRLSHPNIVTVFDAGEQDGLLYIAMELLDGETLDAHLAKHRTVALDRAIDITRQICAALDYANAKGVVHRDIKPANIILLPNGNVKITDFGLARTAEAITMTGQVMGTPHYMSPEQVRGRPVDGRSDLFSVGVMLYEMVTGERPFEGQSITTIMYKIVHENPTPPRALDSTIPAGLSAVIERSMAKSPEERFQTGAALVEALDNYNKFQSSASVTAPINVPHDTLPVSPLTVAAGASPAPAKKSRAFGRFLVVAVLVAVAAVIFFGVFHRSSRPTPTASTTTQTQAPVPPPAPASPTNGESSQSQPATTSQGVVETHPSTSGASTASMTVKSKPPTAAILLDHKPTGLHTPAQLQLSRGDHTVSLEMDGFKAESANVRVQGGESFEFSPQLSVQLPNVPGVSIPDLKKLGQIPQSEMANAQFWQQWARTEAQGAAGVPDSELAILVNTHPSGAHIFVDSTDTGQLSPAIIPEKPGTYHVRLELQGYETTERKVKVKSGRSAKINLTLKPASANK
jgi:serine/threonine protein kinase